MMISCLNDGDIGFSFEFKNSYSRYDKKSSKGLFLGTPYIIPVIIPHRRCQVEEMSTIGPGILRSLAHHLSYYYYSWSWSVYNVHVQIRLLIFFYCPSLFTIALLTSLHFLLSNRCFCSGWCLFISPFIFRRS